MNKSNRLGGFSLVELMIALVLSLFLMGSVSLMYLSSRSTSIDAEGLSRIQENIRFATDYLIRDIRNAGFDDVEGLSVGDVFEVNNPFAEVAKDGSLIIRYAGRGHCAQRFDEFEVVQNTYSVEIPEGSGVGTLRCRGEVWDGSQFSADPTIPFVDLVSGLSGLSFTFICADNSTCGDVCSKSDINPCVGARIRLDFPGLRSMQGNANTTRSVELVAAFRNTVLDRLYQYVVDQE